MRKTINKSIALSIILSTSACDNNEKVIEKPIKKEVKLTPEQEFKKKLIGKFDAGYGTLEFRKDGTLKSEMLGSKKIEKYEIDGFVDNYAIVDFIKSNNDIDTFYLRFDENNDLLKTYRIGENEDTFKRQ